MQKFTPLQYLQMDIAANFGTGSGSLPVSLDRTNWDTRLTWFQENEHQLVELINKADEPSLFFAGLQAYSDTENGIPSGYPISLDATSSGLQILSVLTGDRSAAAICNVVNKYQQEGIDAGVPERVDAYTTVYHYMLAVLGDTAKISRSDTKGAIMTSLYGSKAVPKEVFGEGPLLNVFYAVMQQLCPAAWELNETFLAIWNPEALSYHWKLPDNFHVHTKVMATARDTVHFLNEPFEVTRQINAPIQEGRSLGANTVHSIDGMIVREMVRRCDYDVNQIKYVQALLDGDHVTNNKLNDAKYVDDTCKMAQILWEHYKKSGYLSARILDYIIPQSLILMDTSVIQELLDSLPPKPFKIMTIHDCFRCLPNYANELREQYTNQLYLIARSDLLSYLLTQIMGREVSVGKLDSTVANDVLNTEYALS